MPVKPAPFARFLIIAAMSAFGGTLLYLTPATATAFGLPEVAAKAKQLSQKPYKKPEEVPQKFQKLSFDQWDSIKLRSNAKLWPNNNFNVKFRPAGYLYKYPVKIDVINTQGVHPVRFSPQMFKYSKKKLGTDLPKNLGFAGFQILYPLKRATPGQHKRKCPPSKQAQGNGHAGKPKAKHNEMLSFLGATYFRARAGGQVLGLSARGLAINTATNSGEEFPYFTQFWLARPDRTSHAMVIYALLDSPSITGAYRFAIWPGSPTKMVVKAVLYPRGKIQKLGLAPLTSMYLYGQGRTRPPGYLYPAVHDSDGLLLHTKDDQWIWRPLSDPSSLSDNDFYIQNPQGFGLMQRDRNGNNYPTIPSPYQRRPSAWVQPDGQWGKGHIELVEIPSPNANNDNITAFWVPAQPPPAHKPLRFGYTLYWQGNKPPRSPRGRVVATHINSTKSDKATRRFAIDFKGGPLKGLKSGAKVKSVIEAGDNGKIVDPELNKDRYTGTWRLQFSVKSKDGKSVQLRAYLAQDKKALTETWDYVMPGSS